MQDRTCDRVGCHQLAVRNFALCSTHRREARGCATPRGSRQQTPCAIEDCSRLGDGGYGWCQSHYRRYRQTGDPLLTLAMAAAQRELEVGERECVSCEATKPLELFPRSPRSRNGRARECNACRSLRAADQYDRQLQQEPGKIQHRNRERYLFKAHGLTLAAVDEMAAEQGRRCAICRRSQALVIDHCHRSGRVRALLCNDCNLALGHVRDNPAVLNSMIGYLNRHEGASQ